MDDIRSCSKCKIEKLLINFRKKKLTKDGVNSICEGCMKDFYLDNSIKFFRNRKIII